MASSFLGRYLKKPDNESEDPNQRKKYDAAKSEEYSKRPMWERMMTEIPSGIMDGILNRDPQVSKPTRIGDRSIRDNTNLATQVLGMGAPALGITKYLKGGIPDKVAREAGTKVFRDTINNTKDIGIVEGGKNFANRYPRIAAHMDPYVMSPYDSDTYRGLAHTQSAFGPYAPTKAMIEIKPGMKAGDATNTIAHEGAHVAQTLGLGRNDFNQLYDRANYSVGYANNPFERSAQAIGHRAQKAHETGKNTNFSPNNTMGQFEEIIKEMPSFESNRVVMDKIMSRRSPARKSGK